MHAPCLSTRRKRWRRNDFQSGKLQKRFLWAFCVWVANPLLRIQINKNKSAQMQKSKWKTEKLFSGVKLFPENLTSFGLRETYPWNGSKTIALGSSKPSWISNFRYLPSIFDTSIVPLPLSHQYKFFPTQSTAIPSGLCTVVCST